MFGSHENGLTSNMTPHTCVEHSIYAHVLGSAVIQCSMYAILNSLSVKQTCQPQHVPTRTCGFMPGNLSLMALTSNSTIEPQNQCFRRIFGERHYRLIITICSFNGTKRLARWLAACGFVREASTV